LDPSGLERVCTRPTSRRVDGDEDMAATARALARVAEGPIRVRSELLQVPSTEATQFLDLTEALASFLKRSAIRHGLLNVQTRHTTTGLFVNENEPLLVEDFAGLLERWAPRHAGYRHDDLEERADVPPDERANGHSHARALLFGTSVSLNVVEGQMQLGPWQRVFLVELDGARNRSVSVLAMGLGAERSSFAEEGRPPQEERKMSRAASRVVGVLVAGALPLLSLLGVACRNTPPPPPDPATLKWTTYSNPVVGYTLEVPDLYRPSTHHGDRDVMFRYDRFPVLVVNYIDLEEGKHRGLWPGHES